MARVPRFLAFAAGLFGLGVAACEEGPSVITSYKRTGLDSLLVDASNKGPVLTHVIGAPFGDGSDAFGYGVRTLLASVARQRKVRFTGDPAEAPVPSFRVIIAFDAAENFDGPHLCRGDVPEPAPREGRVSVIAVVCSTDTLWAQVDGFVSGVESPEDRKFRDLITQVSIELLGR